MNPKRVEAVLKRLRAERKQMTEFTQRVWEPEQDELAAQDLMKQWDQGGETQARITAGLELGPGAFREEVYQKLLAVIKSDHEHCEVWRNDTYQVAIYNKDKPIHKDWPRMIHLSIKRIDREVIRDWRELQMIKNRLIGRENEAVELFPAESRRVDMANQYHLWVLADPKKRFPFGFSEGLVADAVEGSLSKQRPLEQTKG